ncbi:MAG: flagellar motor switch protein FliM [Candidatus Muiribacteriota bacterium]
MAQEVLNQDEIDALLTSISGPSGQKKDAGSPAGGQQQSGGNQSQNTAANTNKPIDNKKIKIYDFKRPDKFAKEQLRTLNRIHEAFSRLVSTYLSTTLRTIVNFDVVSVDQLTYEEFTRTLANPTFLSIMSMGTLDGNSVIEINLNLVFSILDKLFGGQGRSLDNPRILTDIEESVISRVIVKILEYFKESWLQVIELSPKIEFIESNPQFTQIVPPNEMVLLVTFEVKIAETEGIMNLCIPYIVLEPIIGKLTTQSWFKPKKKEISSENLLNLETKLKRVDVPVVVELGKSEIDVKDFLLLKAGDAVKLNTKITDNLNIVVNGALKFQGKAGKKGKNVAVVVKDVIKDEEEAMNL